MDLQRPARSRDPIPVVGTSSGSAGWGRLSVGSWRCPRASSVLGHLDRVGQWWFARCCRHARPKDPCMGHADGLQYAPADPAALAAWELERNGSRGTGDTSETYHGEGGAETRACLPYGTASSDSVEPSGLGVSIMSNALWRAPTLQAFLPVPPALCRLRAIGAKAR